MTGFERRTRKHSRLDVITKGATEDQDSLSQQIYSLIQIVPLPSLFRSATQGARQGPEARRYVRGLAETSVREGVAAACNEQVHASVRRIGPVLRRG